MCATYACIPAHSRQGRSAAPADGPVSQEQYNQLLQRCQQLEIENNEWRQKYQSLGERAKGFFDEIQEKNEKINSLRETATEAVASKEEEACGCPDACRCSLRWCCCLQRLRLSVRECAARATRLLGRHHVAQTRCILQALACVRPVADVLYAKSHAYCECLESVHADGLGLYI